MLNSDKFFKIKADPSFNPENVDKESFIFENSRENIGYARQLEMLYDKIDAFFAAQPESSYCLNFDELTTLLISWYGLKGKDPIMFNTVLGLFGLSLNEAMDIDDEYVDQVRESSMNILIQKKNGDPGRR